jgi:hypothetical protein
MLARTLLVLGLCMSASTALADARVLVLGMRSIEGDDELANALTEQLRSVARTVDGWAVSETAVSMAQMSLAHGCDELDAACLAEIAQSLQVERVVFGTIRRTSARDDHAFAVMLSLFDAQTGEIARQIDDTITQDQVDTSTLATHAQRMVERLLSVSTGGAIAVQANVADATVSINGQAVGQTREGALRIEGLQPGQYRVEVGKPGYLAHVSTVSVNEGADTSLAAVLTQAGAAPAQAPYVDDSIDDHAGHHGSNLSWLGWTLVGVGGAALIGTFASMGVVADINHDALYEDYRDAVARGNDKVRSAGKPEEVVNDVCDAADAGSRYDFSEGDFQKVADLCSKGATFEVLQWVFLGTALAAGGTGAYLILSASDDEPEDAPRENARLRIQPSIAPNRASLTATLRF